MKQPDTKGVQLFAASTALASWSACSAVLSVVGGCLLVSLGAQLRIPIPGSDVPMTLQLLTVLLTGYALSPMRAAAAMVLYLLCGAAGLPVFAGSEGLTGSTGGYLIGFLAAAWLVSVLKGGREAGYGRLLIAGAAGTFAVFVFGIAWRVVLVLLFGRWGGVVGSAVAMGLMPFAVKAVIELLLAVTWVVTVRRLRLAGKQRRVLEG